MTQTPPAPIRTDGSNAFAHRSMKERVPRILGDVLERNPDYSDAIRSRIQRLREAIAGDAPVELFEGPAPDRDLWEARVAAHEGETWLGTGWFFAEMLAYRRLVHACRFWTTDRDPFRPMKADEMESDELQEALGEALEREGPRRERLYRALVGALWGNRMDLSIQSAADQGTDAAGDHLLDDDVPAALDDLLSGEAGTVHVIMDNAGTEEAFDLALADLLLREDAARRVVLHVKMMPVLVSDVLVKDIWWLLDVLEEHGGRLADLAARLRRHVEADRIRIVPDAFWNTDGRMSELPPRIHGAFADADLVIGKGDANYRRATNDAVWPSGSTWAEAAAPVPAPFLALRTIKSDTLVGVPPETVQALDEAHDAWRTTGTYGVAQYEPSTTS